MQTLIDNIFEHIFGSDIDLLFIQLFILRKYFNSGLILIELNVH
jgi:hypothetical protein